VNNVKPVRKQEKDMKKTILATITVAAALLASAPLAKANAYIEAVSGINSITSGVIVGNNPSASIGGTVGGWDFTFNLGHANGGITYDISSIDSGTRITDPLTIIYQSVGAAAFGPGTYKLATTGNISFSSVQVGNNYVASTGSVNLSVKVYDSAGLVYTLPVLGDLINSQGQTLLSPGGSLGIPDKTGSMTSLDVFTEIITITPAFDTGSPHGLSASLDGSFNYIPGIPDGGLTIAMLGSVLIGLAGIASKFGKRA
jgi:hypothetical protein